MGGRGASWRDGPYEGTQNWHQVGWIGGAKVLKRYDSYRNHNASRNLPIRSHSPNAIYVIYNRDGSFHQMRVFGKNCLPKMDIDVHQYKDIDNFYHKHIWHQSNPGVSPQKVGGHIPLTKEEMKKYSEIFKKRIEYA